MADFNLEDFRAKMLKDINEIRVIHSAEPLAFDPEINSSAQAWAEKLAAAGKLLHRTDAKYGENLAFTTYIQGFDPVKLWYSEEPKANYTQLGQNANCFHFTQLVWKKSKHIGIGVAKSPNKAGWFIVADFDPPGNVLGTFAANVSPKTT
uniref:SCP domain-containing protein n=1 Tax=Panagrellus redivivus TaxID=6233 RepID=A0A7E4V2Q4_PANRE